MEITVLYSAKCGLCGAEHISADKGESERLGNECEALGGHEFKFAVGDRICDNSQRAEGPLNARVLACYLQIRTHEPIYVVQVESDNPIRVQQEWLAGGIEHRATLISESS